MNACGAKFRLDIGHCMHKECMFDFILMIVCRLINFSLIFLFLFSWRLVLTWRTCSATSWRCLRLRLEWVTNTSNDERERRFYRKPKCEKRLIRLKYCDFLFFSSLCVCSVAILTVSCLLSSFRSSTLVSLCNYAYDFRLLCPCYTCFSVNFKIFWRYLDILSIENNHTNLASGALFLCTLIPYEKC